MRGIVKITARLQGQDVPFVDEIAVEYPGPEAEGAVLARLLQSFTAIGGLVKSIGPGHVRLIPSVQVLALDLEFQQVVIADTSDVPPANGKIHLAS